jgi:hypothetical protein
MKVWSLLALALLAGCSAQGPTDITQHMNPERAYATSRVLHYAQRLSIPSPEVLFQTPPDPRIAGWVVPGVSIVHFNAAWIAQPAPSDQVDAVAAHETCHLLVGPSEDAANACAAGLR